MVINIDLIYQTQRELHDYCLYTQKEIDLVIEIYSVSRHDNKSLGKMTSALQPIAVRYNKKTPDERYQFRRKLRSFIKWYGYISQICRMFDTELQKEYIFCQNLLKLLPADITVMFDLENALQLEFYKLEKTFKGNIGLTDKSGEYEPARAKGKTSPEKKEPLEEIIEKLNQITGNNCTEADRIILYILHDKIKGDKKLSKIAKTSDSQVFMESIFPKSFDSAAQDSYIEQTEAFTELFKNKSKYHAIMMALAEMIYKEFNK